MTTGRINQVTIPSLEALLFSKAAVPSSKETYQNSNILTSSIRALVSTDVFKPSSIQAPSSAHP